MNEYGLQEPEFVDMEIALRINLYRSEGAIAWNTEEMKGNANRVQDDTLNMLIENKMRENRKVRLKCAKSALKFKLSAQEETIVNYIAENGRITSGQLMTLLNVRKRRAQIILGKLVDEGVICKKGASRSTCYVFNDALSED